MLIAALCICFMDLAVCALFSLVLLEQRSSVWWFASSGGLVGHWVVWLDCLVVSEVWLMSESLVVGAVVALCPASVLHTLLC